jgi:hypothetical protein
MSAQLVALIAVIAVAVWAFLYVFIGLQTWILYLAVENLVKARDAGHLTPAASKVGKCMLAYALLSDFIFNVLNTPVFMELPREMLFTPRVSRHCKAVGWRGDRARWFCANALDPFAPGDDHCGCHSSPA